MGDEMLRFNEGKPRVSIFPPIVHQCFIMSRTPYRDLAVAVSRVLEFGAKKYDLHNWKRSGSWHRCADSAVRHVLAIIEGEEIDPESNLPHLDHFSCNVCFLLEFESYQTGEDDRWKGYQKPNLVEHDDASPMEEAFLLFFAWLDGGNSCLLGSCLDALATHYKESQNA